ncbi:MULTISPECIES: response regulator transcription factor [unclassified Arcicella]|uniref:response regulator transcription factor n=1 Tax=unclassified Arcicella TaxID=2644986 RepID=UPI00285596CF|nr:MULTISPECIES: response regulator transcription factor [unclassified Arcicella]MDR6564850.1 DNA-binding response OmpR family regulator [Arcicella sp. BE51]MDR6814617.1 DNA-binding response OmpR family regulator [Arcicella sp. BE140]MDR6826063.1 DNA-binding response OmpR family regulator [Arcicella sp. BE139]
MTKILLVEDDDSLGFVIKDNLEQEGYTIDLQTDGKAGQKAFQNNQYDICVFDVMLPEMDGFSLAEFVRGTGSEVPIIFLTAKSLKEDRIKGLKLGADDYLTKPFSIEELVLRIEAILKRTGKKTGQVVNQNIHNIGKYTFDVKNLKLFFENETQDLTHREADLLAFLVNNKNETLSRDKILIAIWGDDDYFKGRSLDVFITRLRKYLNKDQNIKLTNVHGVGFRFDVP